METQDDPKVLAKIDRPKAVDGMQDAFVLASSLARKLDRLASDPELAWLTTEAGRRAVGMIKVASGALEQLQYHAMCPSCGGKKCAFCYRTGWVPQWRYEEWELANE